MKKWLLFLLAGMVLLGMAGCGETPTETRDTEPEFTLTQDGYTYAMYPEDSGVIEAKELDITDAATGVLLQTLRFAGNEWFTAQPMYRIDVNFDGHADVVVPFVRPAGGAYFQAYLWDAAAGQYRRSPTFENLANIALDAETGMLLFSRTSDKITTYGMCRYDAEKKDYVLVRSLVWEPSEDQLTMTVTEQDYTAEEEKQTRTFSAALAEDGISLDATDEVMAPYFADDSVWDLDGQKWDIPLLSRSEYLY